MRARRSARPSSPLTLQRVAECSHWDMTADGLQATYAIGELDFFGHADLLAIFTATVKQRLDLNAGNQPAAPNFRPFANRQEIAGFFVVEVRKIGFDLFMQALE